MAKLARTVIALLCVLPLAAQAADKGSREREALRRAQETVAQLQQEKAGLEQAKQDLDAKVAELPKQIDKLKQDSDKEKARAAAMERSARDLGKENADLKEKLATAERRLADLEDARKKLAQTSADDSKRLNTEKAALQTSLGKQTEATQVCETKNGQLAAIAGELMQRYENKGVWSALLQAEPVLQFKQVEVQNLIEEYHDKVARQTIDTPAKTR